MDVALQPWRAISTAIEVWTRRATKVRGKLSRAQAVWLCRPWPHVRITNSKPSAHEEREGSALWPGHMRKYGVLPARRAGSATTAGQCE